MSQNKSTFERQLTVLTDIFLSHDWGPDRANHKKVKIINEELKKTYNTWFDEDDGRMEGDVHDSMASGIEGAKMGLVFVTHEYRNKVNGDGCNGVSDNCYLEFRHMVKQLTTQKLVAVVMDPNLKNDKNWKGVLGLNLAGKLFVNLTKGDLADPAYLAEAMTLLHKAIDTILHLDHSLHTVTTPPAATVTTPPAATVTTPPAATVTTPPAATVTAPPAAKATTKKKAATPPAPAPESAFRTIVLEKSVKAIIKKPIEMEMDEDSEIVFGLAYKFGIEQAEINRIKAAKAGGGKPHEAFIGKIRSQNSEVTIEDVGEALEALSMNKAKSVLDDIVDLEDDDEERELFNEIEEHEVRPLYKYLVYDAVNPGIMSWVDLAQQLDMSEEVESFRAKMATGGAYSPSNELFNHLKRDGTTLRQFLSKLGEVRDDKDLPSTKRIEDMIEEEIEKATTKEEKLAAKKTAKKGKNR